MQKVVEAGGNNTPGEEVGQQAKTSDCSVHDHFLETIKDVA